MKILLVLCWFLVLGTPTVQGSLWQLRSMLNKATGKSAFLNYAFYGCFCGYDGKGQPLDDTDRVALAGSLFLPLLPIFFARCCWAHDCCYEKLEGKCDSKLQHYSFTYDTDIITCNDSEFCKSESCICDKVLAYCLKEHMGSFNSSYKHFPGSQCSEKNLPCPA